MTTENTALPAKPRRILKPGDEVWFEVNGYDYEGTVLEDDGGLHVIVDVKGAGVVDMYYGMLAHCEED